MSAPNATPTFDTKDSSLHSPNIESDASHTDGNASKDELAGDKEIIYPEGGARGWAVAVGGAAILFSTFGYANSFG